jgi:predicted dehydrogenase
MKTSLIVGMGIGNLYATVLNNLGHGVVTVDSDPNKSADFTSVDAAIEKCLMFDTVHICTPNFTHEEIARKLAPVSKIVFIEKPGLKTANDWQRLVEDFPRTRFMMVKNNMWRDNIEEMKQFVPLSSYISVQWCNKDRIPNPGGWFTTRELSFGGVSRDLMPHLLSLFVALYPTWRTAKINSSDLSQTYELRDLLKSDYGTVNRDGIYDVDDNARIEFDNKIELLTQWKNDSADMRLIRFTLGREYKTFELGLCPENAYQTMIKDAVENIDNPQFWLNQIEIDIWIHTQLSMLTTRHQKS